MSESTIGKLEELRTQTQNLGKAYRELFPKVDPAFVYDLILRLSENPENNAPVYTVEVFTKEGTNPEKSKERILQTTGTIPAIYDNGTHYVSTQRMTLDMLKSSTGPLSCARTPANGCSPRSTRWATAATTPPGCWPPTGPAGSG